MEAEQRQRIERELALLEEGGLTADLVEPDEQRAFVIYRAVPTSGAERGLPAQTDVIVPVPSGYPASAIDLAGLPVSSGLLAHVPGGTNNQGRVHVDGQEFQLASYHPHDNGGGPPWDPTVHGFHTYVDHLLAWLEKLS